MDIIKQWNLKLLMFVEWCIQQLYSEL